MSQSSGYLSHQALEKVIESVGKHKGVYGAVLSDTDGLPLQSSLPSEDTERVAAHVASLVGKVRYISEEISQEAARSVRLELEVGDVEIIPDYDSEIIIIALVKRESSKVTLTSRD
jgi:predicted regulator of Ras-like GTPase activity (Roadblock/LC7/MglB family)